MEFAYIRVTFGLATPMLSGKIGKAFEPSHHHPAEDQQESRGKDRQEHHGDDRGEHRGISHGTAGNGFLTILIAGSC